MTAYREEALRLACELERRGEARVKDLRAAAGCDKAGAVLRDNFYGWFERVERGIYRLTGAGREALGKYGDVVEEWRNGGAEETGRQGDGEMGRRGERKIRKRDSGSGSPS